MKKFLCGILIAIALVAAFLGGSRFTKYSIDVCEVRGGVYEITDWTGMTDIYYEEVN